MFELKWYQSIPKAYQKQGYFNNSEQVDTIKKEGVKVLPGSHTLQENHFRIEGNKFVVKKRKKAAESKPELYLIQVQPFKYISSLFPSGSPGAFTIDYEEKVYNLKMEECQVVITEKE